MNKEIWINGRVDEWEMFLDGIVDGWKWGWMWMDGFKMEVILGFRWVNR